jgi:hypothetical protein
VVKTFRSPSLIPKHLRPLNLANCESQARGRGMPGPLTAAR